MARLAALLGGKLLSQLLRLVRAVLVQLLLQVRHKALGAGVDGGGVRRDAALSNRAVWPHADVHSWDAGAERWSLRRHRIGALLEERVGHRERLGSYSGSARVWWKR